MAKTIGNELPDMLPGSSDANEYCDAIKMMTSIISWISIDAETEAIKPKQHLTEEPVKKSKGKSKEIVPSWNWDNERFRASTTLAAMAQLDLNRLWPSGCPEEQFITFV